MADGWTIVADSVRFPPTHHGPIQDGPGNSRSGRVPPATAHHPILTLPEICVFARTFATLGVPPTGYYRTARRARRVSAQPVSFYDHDLETHQNQHPAYSLESTGRKPLKRAHPNTEKTQGELATFHPRQKTVVSTVRSPPGRSVAVRRSPGFGSVRITFSTRAGDRRSHVEPGIRRQVVATLELVGPALESSDGRLRCAGRQYQHWCLEFRGGNWRGSHVDGARRRAFARAVDGRHGVIRILSVAKAAVCVGRTSHRADRRVSPSAGGRAFDVVTRRPRPTVSSSRRRCLSCEWHSSPLARPGAARPYLLSKVLSWAVRSVLDKAAS